MPNTITNLVDGGFEALPDVISAMKICAPSQKLPQIASNVLQKSRDLPVRKIGKYYFAIGEHADLWLGNMLTKDGGCKMVALKQPRDGIVEKQPGLMGRIIERLRQYSQVAHSFDHPNVVRVLGLSDIHDPVPYLILPYFINGDIVNYLKHNPGKTDEEKIELAKGILAGLAYLHRRGIVHGKGNVLVDDNGIAMLCDAKYDPVMFSENEYCTLPSKCWWMPHERLIVDDNATDSCLVAPPSMSADIYGAALTIAQMWTLRRPFYGMRDEFELIGTLHKLKTGQLAQLGRPEEVPVIVWALFQNCLSIDPLARPTAEILLTSFEESLAMKEKEYAGEC